MAGDEVPLTPEEIEQRKNTPRPTVNLRDYMEFNKIMKANGMPVRKSRLGEMMAGVMIQATHDAEFNSMFGLPQDIVGEDPPSPKPGTPEG